MDAFAATRLAVGAGFLVVAAVSDVRTRRVRDPLWIALGTIGLIVLAAELFGKGASWPAWSLLASGAVLFYTVFLGRPLFEEDGFHPRSVRLFLFFIAGLLFLLALSMAGSARSSPSIPELASMPAMIVIYQGFYRLRLLHGGADAKGLIALSLLVPTHPEASPFPLLAVDPIVASVLRTLFPFSLVVWLDAALVSLAVPIALFAYNAARGDFAIPQAFLGYRAPVDAFPAHAWLMEKITERGDHVLVLFPKRGLDPAADLARLRAAGIDRVWVTPQTPFLVALLAGFLLAFFAGNLLVGVLGLGR